MATKKVTKKTTAKRASKKTPAKKASGRARTSKTSERTIPLKKICADLGLDANCNVRAKLRRVWRSDESKLFNDHGHGERWVFSPTEAKEVRAILEPAE